ncbi:sialidase family protein [Neorhodopirellula pilleata]|uniref:BNR/Asp-box repeat protein n=1 Tax=Neorhodopirellula pilleata TaxID=2714738 RepID=A0A5C6AUM9_9BACT|nr:sialidase family protein [Neorhodopirellula pilleata]TWU03177.1 BNR/Asp-box repeat protein [Neorhodopirellula pilleata]
MLSSTCFAESKSKQPEVTAEIIETKQISPRPMEYCGWPTLARQTSGKLMLAWSGMREQHVCPFGTVQWMTSDDGGASWTWPRTLIDSVIDDRDAGVLQTAKGSILVTSFSSLAYESILAKAEKEGSWPEDRLSRWRSAGYRVGSSQRKAELGTWLIRSTDGGMSWSSRVDSLVNSPHGPTQLSDGRLLYAGKQLWHDNPRVGVAVSDDDGISWQWLAEITARPGDEPNQYHELHAIEAADGRIIVQIRNHNSANSGETLQCESIDGGQTWSTPRAIGVWGLPSHLIRLADDRLLMTYGHRRVPYGNLARLSDDQGRTWSSPLTISDDASNGDLGYPSTVQLDDGRLVTVWYEKTKSQAYAVLRQATWRLT